jgi:hypothetical protein
MTTELKNAPAVGLVSTAWLGVSVSVNGSNMTEATVGVPALANGCPPLCEGCGEPKLYRGREATSLMCCSACWQRLPKWMREASTNGGVLLWENRIAVTLLWMREASSPNAKLSGSEGGKD